MESADHILFAMLGYRLVVLLIGATFDFLGYRLVTLGIYEKAGELKASWTGASLVLRQAAPGTFFALFGAAVIAVSLFNPTELHHREANSIPLSTATPAQVRSSGAADTAPTTAAADRAILEKILSKVNKGQQLEKGDKDALKEVLLDLQASSLSRMSDTDARTMLDNMN